MTEPRITVLPEDVQEACDRANAQHGSTRFTTLCEAIAELREFRAEVDAKVREVMSTVLAFGTDDFGLRSLMLPEPVDPLEALVKEFLAGWSGSYFSTTGLLDFARQAAAIGEARRG